MSLIDKKVKSEYSSRILAAKPEILLSKNILYQIDHLHDKVGADEWSGVLVYTIDSGSIEDPDNLEITVLEIIPMDVGTSAYTEYEFDLAGDSYQFDNIGRVMMDNTLKMGHIHSHHNMNCFFSGTDQQELHDNAPNHNYYLSLIVNFKSPENWCAKIAFIGEESKVSKTTTKFKGTSGEIQTISTNDESTTNILYTLDCDLFIEDVDLQVSNDFKSRVKSLQTKKLDLVSKFIPYGKSGITSLKDDEVWKPGFKLDNNIKQFDYSKYNQQQVIEFPKVTTTYDSKKVESFLSKLLSLDGSNEKSLSVILKDLDKHITGDSEILESFRELYLDQVDDTFDDLFNEEFNIVPWGEARSKVVKKCIQILDKLSDVNPSANIIVEHLEISYVLN
jgi:hypothetical protein